MNYYWFNRDELLKKQMKSILKKVVKKGKVSIIKKNK